jgi:hypothetical protein
MYHETSSSDGELVAGSEKAKAIGRLNPKKSRRQTLGRWQEMNLPWYETNILNCSLCGKMIPHRIWVVEMDGGEKKEFCSPECEQLYKEYWLPTHAKESDS